ncbi:MAG: tetratricopeptide repeat protein [Candidatus Micrarchaeota archaeon]
MKTALLTRKNGKTSTAPALPNEERKIRTIMYHGESGSDQIIQEKANIYAGVTRIWRELHARPSDALKYAERYNSLVEAIATSLKTTYSITSGQQTKFFKKFWSITSKMFKIGGFVSTDSLWESLRSGKWDCDDLSFLAFDVGAKLGIKLEFVLLEGHMLIKSRDYYFETTNGRYFPLKLLTKALKQVSKDYSQIYSITSSREEVQTVTYGNLGGTLSEKGKNETAITYLERAIELSPNNSDNYYVLALIYTELKNYRQAIRFFKKTLKLEPQYAEAHSGLGGVYLALGKHKEAHSHLTKCIQLISKRKNWDADLYCTLGLAFRELDDLGRASRYLRKAVKLKPNDAVFLCNTADLYMRRGRYAQAAHYAKQAIMTNSSHAISYANLACCYLMQRNYQKAIQYANTSLKLNKSAAAPEAYCHLGAAHYKLGNYERALKAFQNAVDFDSHYFWTRFDLGVLYIKTGEYRKAVRALNKAVKLNSKHAQTYRHLWTAYSKLGEKEEARKAYRKYERRKARGIALHRS